MSRNEHKEKRSDETTLRLSIQGCQPAPGIALSVKHERRSYDHYKLKKGFYKCRIYHTFTINASIRQVLCFVRFTKHWTPERFQIKYRMFDEMFKRRCSRGRDSWKTTYINNIGTIEAKEIKLFVVKSSTTRPISVSTVKGHDVRLTVYEI